MSVDQQKIAAILEECARKYILPRYRNLQNSEIQTKKHANDFVTIADIETEEALVEILPKIVPGAIVIGEEGVSSGKITTEALNDATKTIFVVDPVDGTRNFKNGDPKFALMMALVQGGETRMSWIYDVVGNVHYLGEKGSGAYCGGERLYIDKQSRAFSESTGFGYLKFGSAEDKVKSYTNLLCAAHEYIRIASAEADFCIYDFMTPWDHLAGVLMVQEAGGVVKKWDKSPYLVTDNRGGLLIASSDDLWDWIHKTFLNPALEQE